MKKIPIADCPRCGRIILYSSNPADKKLYKTELATEDYVGRFAQCNKCRSVVAILESEIKGEHQNDYRSYFCSILMLFLIVEGRDAY